MASVGRLSEAERVAIVMLSARGRAQKDIAKRFGVRQSTVSRVLKAADDDGWLQRSVTVNPKRIDKDLLERALALLSEPDLHKRIAQRVADRRLPSPVTVHVFPTPRSRRREPDYDWSTEHFGASVARHVRDLLAGGVQSCGLTWGLSIGGVVRGIEELAPAAARRSRAVKVVPLCGDPLGRDANSLLSSSALAQRLSRTINTPPTSTLSLAMLPAFLPGDFSAAEVNTVWKLIAKMHAYALIFGGRHARDAAASGRRAVAHHANQLDMILTGISAAGRPLGDGHGPLFESGGLTEARFNELVLADIGGVLIEKGELSPGRRAALTRLKMRWTGLNARELGACAARATAAQNDPRKPGVVLVAAGKLKAESVQAAVRLGLVNQLLIDAELEAELMNRFAV